MRRVVEKNKSYEIAYQPTENSEVCIIMSTLKKKLSFMLQKLKNQGLCAMFEKPSDCFKEMWSVDGDDSPIRYRSKLKLTIDKF